MTLLMNGLKKHGWGFLSLCVISFLLSACGGSDNNDNNTGDNSNNETAQFRILTLGDSRVEGSRPDYESYRYELWQNLVENGWSVDLIGPYRDNADYLDFMSTTFDRDHAGVGGATTQDVLNNLNATLEAANQPDIVLLGIGGNDLLTDTGFNTDVDGSINRINQIIDQLQSHNPNVTIFLEQIAPAVSILMLPPIMEVYDEFNARILDVATQQTTVASRVIAVDMATGWRDVYLADTVHYNETGAEIVADRYYAQMDTFIER